MNAWPPQPLIYEINAQVWLEELRQRHGADLDLGTIPGESWDAIAELGVDAVWLMGVWQRSPAGRAVAMQNAALMAEFQEVLPDLEEDDILGSAYCVRRYVADEGLGGPQALARARRELTRRNMRLVLDYVPNHVAPDHPWCVEHPEYFIQGTAEDLERDGSAFLSVGDQIMACGKDPCFSPWQDVVQVNAFHKGLRAAAIAAATEIASQCDAMRCDMAMLVMNSIFARTWGRRAGDMPDEDYWPQVIGAVKAHYPDVRFIAEAYWDLEADLQQQGFDYCYDKRLYDRLKYDSAESVRLHLLADLTYQSRLVRFVENHDEARAAAVFPRDKHKAVAIAALTLPGARLLHEGQFEGRTVRIPVFLRRRPTETVDGQIEAFYHELLEAVAGEPFRQGQWELCSRNGWADNSSFANIAAWCWRYESDCRLVVVNLSERRSQATVRLPWRELAGRPWLLRDAFSDTAFDRQGDEMLDPGLFVDLEGWKYHLLEFSLT